jgi:prepilin-type N-terminal cleavage/methylation domain-containing protein
MSWQRNPQAGFTLLEMLVTMVLFSLVLSSFGVLFSRLGKTNAAIARIERSENVEVVRRYVQQSLESIRAYSRADRNGGMIVQFDGNRSRVAFVGVAAGDRETGGLYETELWLESDGKLLQRRRRLGWGRGTQAVPEVLLDGLATLTLSYSACPNELLGADVHRWRHARQLPFLISVKAEFKAEDPRVWREVSAFTPAAGCQLGM